MLRRSNFRWALSGTSRLLCSTESPVQLPTSANGSARTIIDYTPKEVVGILDQYVVGQAGAKRAVAVALRNRWRRSQLKDTGLRSDVTPKNILMIGPTGVGKTEIARRMARVTDAPFIKVEATKYTEVGFKGKDVESIVEDLYSASKNKARQRLERERDGEAQKAALDTIFSTLTKMGEYASLSLDEFNAKLTTGELDDVVVSVSRTVPQPAKPKGPEGGFLGFELVVAGLGGGGSDGGQRETISRPVPEAIKIAKQEAFKKLITESSTLETAKRLAEEEGIVFIDEIDKVVADQASASHDVSSLGVQQDLLPLIEGSNVTVKDGTTISTDNVLFVCSGAFHVVKPSDMIAELQGRLPVRVELEALSEADFRRILMEPTYNLLRQQQALMEVENIKLVFAEDSVSAMAKTAAEVNKNTQNIGARRLHTIIERIMDEPSFNCQDHAGKELTIDGEAVFKATEKLNKNVELTRYLL